MIRIPQVEYARRRADLIARMEPGSIAILPAAREQLRNSDVEHTYRQDSDFQYLSGFPEPEAVLVLIPGREEGQCILFCRDRDPERELWDGRRAGQDGAVRDYGADDAYSIRAIDELLPSLMENRQRVYYAIGCQDSLDQQVMGWVNQVRARVRQGVSAPSEFVALAPLLHPLRLRKSAAELEVMRYAAQVSARAHVRAMQASRAGLYEYQLEAELEYEFRKGGARLPAYGSIVASGHNACILHYRENDALLSAGDLVLIDAACEIDCYASDITRTFPVDGRFTSEQQALYELVLEANMEAFKHIAPGKRWNEAHDATVRVITAGLVKLGLLRGDVNELIESEAYKPFYMHRAGHWLGMDVHDVGDYKVNGAWRELEPGMCMTVEPGIYVAVDNETVEPRWRGIGVRIEDDVVVTADGCEILTGDVPKTVAAIEALMSDAREYR
jgi:Xaa-Pro aminopeptidase